MMMFVIRDLILMRSIDLSSDQVSQSVSQSVSVSRHVRPGCPTVPPPFTTIPANTPETHLVHV